MGDDWTGTIAAERMELDNEFAEQVEASSFSGQQWNLIMTALEFDIENPGDPAEARIVPETGNLSAIMPELDRIEQQGPMGGAGGSGGSGGGLIDSITGALGLGGGGDDEQLEEAKQLAEEYCERLQEKLEAGGRWETVRERAQD